MSLEQCNSQVIQLAGEIVKIVQGVVDGIVDPTNPDLHRMLVAKYVWLSDHTNTGQPLPDAIEMCLIDIISCEGASWDTPMWSIRENLENLENVLDSIKEAQKESIHDS